MSRRAAAAAAAAAGFGRELRRRYASEGRLRLLDPIYDPRELFRLRSGCRSYLHGHSVGGTNPSLVEILFFDCDILCWDCSFNRATAGDGVRFFAGAEHLGRLLDEPQPRHLDRAQLRRRYTRDAIADKLVRALRHAS